jgi:hypothetical protein
VKVLVGVGLGIAGAAAWLVSRGHKDPRQWPAAVGEEAARLRAHVAEAAAAGRRAAKEQERALDKELADAEAARNRL